MKSILCGENGAVLGELEKPQVMNGHVVVKVKACALNRADLNMLTGGTHGFVGGLGFLLVLNGQVKLLKWVKTSQSGLSVSG